MTDVQHARLVQVARELVGDLPPLLDAIATIVDDRCLPDESGWQALDAALKEVLMDRAAMVAVLGGP